MEVELEKYFDRLWPINRSLTGDGNRASLKILSEIVDIEIHEVPSGTKCFDWTVPPEWNVKEAWIRNSKGEKVVDFEKHNLHLIGYSVPFRGNMDFENLKKHLYTMPDKPTAIPYLTSYYKKRWGFCLSQNDYDKLDSNDTYEVFIDSELDDSGSMTIGEAYLQGESEREVLLSTYICHPSMANNELSGPLVASFVYNELKKKSKLKYSYRFCFVPETIGSIYMLSKRGGHFQQNLEAGLILTCIGNDGPFTYKKSRRGNALVDRVVLNNFTLSNDECKFIDFFPQGSDERQYCSPGFNLPVGSLMRTMYWDFPQYHTSLDNKDYISFKALRESIEKYLDIIEAFELNEKYINTLPFCEPQLGKRGLYPNFGGKNQNNRFVEIMMWILNLSDGDNDLIDISNRSQISINEIKPVIKELIENGILDFKKNNEIKA